MSEFVALREQIMLMGKCNVCVCLTEDADVAPGYELTPDDGDYPELMGIEMLVGKQRTQSPRQAEEPPLESADESSARKEYQEREPSGHEKDQVWMWARDTVKESKIYQ